MTDQMPRCESCRHFELRGWMDDGVGTCSNPRVRTFAGRGLIAPGGGRFEPVADFGCVFHEAVDPSPIQQAVTFLYSEEAAPLTVAEVREEIRRRFGEAAHRCLARHFADDEPEPGAEESA